LIGMKNAFLRGLTAALMILGMTMAPVAAPAWAADEPGGMVKAASPVTGVEVYQQVCQACHMANAMGGQGAAVIPALANNPRLSVAAYPITVVVNGRGAMPGFTDLLSPTQIANVVGYVRTHFGNAYAKAVTPEDVARIEAARPGP
jgi:mono/diheme cytochrome c family protein